MRLLTLSALGLALAVVSVTPAFALNARVALRSQVPTLKAEAAPLEKVIDNLRKITGANIVVNWKALEAAGVTKEAPITLELSDLTLGKLLDTVLDDASATATLTYTVEGNVIRVTSREEADTRMITRAYPVGDLLLPKNTTFTVPRIGSGNANGNIVSGGGGTGIGGGISGGGGVAGGSLFGGGTTSGTSSNGSSSGSGTRTIDFSADREKAGQALVDMIIGSIRPEVWDKNGGKATAKFYENILVITAPHSVQEAIGGPIRDSERRFGF